MRLEVNVTSYYLEPETSIYIIINIFFSMGAIQIFSWIVPLESKGTPPMPAPPRSKALLRP